jgi:uncharacterized protein YbjQ (UPF0145 family)
MILTTTNSIDNYRISDYKGIVTGTSVDAKTTFSFKHEKNLKMTTDVISKVQESAFLKLKENAEALGANAVVGITIDFESPEGAYFYANVVGTAVSIIKK